LFRCAAEALDRDRPYNRAKPGFEWSQTIERGQLRRWEYGRSRTGLKLHRQTPPPGVVAFYARVSTESQARDSTIASQVAALRERISADGGRHRRG
jgi:hypothetical protein